MSFIRVLIFDKPVYCFVPDWGSRKTRATVRSAASTLSAVTQRGLTSSLSLTYFSFFCSVLLYFHLILSSQMIRILTHIFVHTPSVQDSVRYFKKTTDTHWDKLYFEKRKETTVHYIQGCTVHLLINLLDKYLYDRNGKCKALEVLTFVRNELL